MKTNEDYKRAIIYLENQIEEYKHFAEVNMKLEEEIKKLKEYNRRLKQSNEDLRKQNSYRNKIVDIIPQDEKSVAEETIQDLQERIRFLEQCLDRKEKVNKSLREENKRLSDFLNYDWE